MSSTRQCSRDENEQTSADCTRRAENNELIIRTIFHTTLYRQETIENVLNDDVLQVRAVGTRR